MNNNLGNKKTMSNNIQKYMKLYNKTRKQVCADLNLSYTTFSDWINAKTYPRIDKIELLANYFNIEKSDLVEENDIDDENIKFNDYFPLYYSSNLSAGTLEELLDYDPDSIVYVPIKYQMMRKRLHAFKVNGDSMNNVFPSESIVIAEDVSHLSKIEDGTIVVAMVNGRATVKRFYQNDNIITLSPDSSNKAFSSITIDTEIDDVYILGRVIWHMNPDDICKFY